MTCDRLEEIISAYLEGELEAAERAAVEAHLKACPACAALLDSVGGAVAELADWPEVEPPPALLERLRAIPSARRPRPAGRLRPVLDWLLRPSLQPVYAAVSVLLLAVTFIAFSSQGQPVRKALDRGFHDGYGRIERLYAKAGSLTGELGGYKDDVLGALRELPLLDRTPEERTDR